MAYKLIHAAQARWRAVNAPHLVALVRAGAIFHKGKLLERPTDITPAANPPEPVEPKGTEVAWNTPVHRYRQLFSCPTSRPRRAHRGRIGAPPGPWGGVRVQVDHSRHG